MALTIVRSCARANALQRNLAFSIIHPSFRNLVSNSYEVQSLEDFKDRVLGSKSTVIVQFHAPWCKPCKMLSPRIEKAIDTQKGKILLAKVNIDNNSDIALDYEVESIPVVAAFKDGKVKEKMIGMQDEDKVMAFVKKYTDD